MLNYNLLFENGETLDVNKGNEIINEIIAILSANKLSLHLSKVMLDEVEKEIYQRAKF